MRRAVTPALITTLAIEPSTLGRPWCFAPIPYLDSLFRLFNCALTRRTPILSVSRSQKPAVNTMSRQQAFKRLQAHRAEARRIESIQAVVQEHNALRGRGEWEGRSELRAAMAARAREEAARAEAVQRATAARLQAEEAERRRLHEQRVAEAAASMPTTQQRRAQLAEQARELAARRERERAAVVEEKLAQQFTSSCDLLRSLQSQRAGQAAAGQWQRQIDERRAADERAAGAELQGQQEFEQYMQRWEDRFQQASVCVWGVFSGQAA